MNIFYLDKHPKTCAQYHVDKHVVKMIIEYAQLLSTAHRVIDGVESIGLSKTGRKQKRYVLSDERESSIYHATHINHPSAQWVRLSSSNYEWLYNLWTNLLDEYTFRYEKQHASGRLLKQLMRAPSNISTTTSYSDPLLAMPDEFKVPGDAIASYRNYYNGSKTRMYKWKKRQSPEWAIVA